jgi:hypothetical protein
MGRWCTDGGAYLFAPTTLTVLRTDGRKTVYHIASIDTQGSNVIVYWQGGSNGANNPNGGKGTKTTFSNFESGHMMQLPLTFDDGSKSKARAFHRC